MKRILFFVIVAVILLFVILQIARVKSDANVLRYSDLDCIAGCGRMCSNDLRTKLKGKGRKEADLILEDYNYQNFSEKEILDKVVECKDRIRKGESPEWMKGPFYPYEELLVR